MKCRAFVLLTVASLAAQPSTGDAANASAIRKTQFDALTLKDGNARSTVGRQIAVDMASAADPDHRPSPTLVTALADDLAMALPAASLRAELLTRITASLVEVLHSAGTSTIGFYESVSRAEKAS